MQTLTPLLTQRACLPINDLLIVDADSMKVCKPGQLGEVWIRGVNVMRVGGCQYRWCILKC